MGRISTFLASEDLPEPYPIDYKSPAAVEVDGDFVWETVYNAGAKERVGPGTPGAEGTGGRRGGKGDGLGGEENRSGGKGNKRRKSASNGKNEADVLPTTTTDLGQNEAKVGEEKDKENEEAERPFQLNNLKFVVPQGAFVAIIGRVGCGKVWINLLAIGYSC